jgi:LysM repeat protein
MNCPNKKHFCSQAGVWEQGLKLLVLAILCTLSLILFPSDVLAGYYATDNLRSAPAFSDIEQSVFKDYTTYLYRLYVIDGYSDGDFHPAEFVTREALAKFVVETFDIPRSEVTTSVYTDVSNDSVFFEYIQALETAGISEPGNLYRPRDYATRAEIVQFVTKAAEFRNPYVFLANPQSGCRESFSDIAEHEAELAICKLYLYNYTPTNECEWHFEPIISGYTPSEGVTTREFKPDDYLTREALTKIIYNAGTMLKVDSFSESTFIQIESYSQPAAEPYCEISDLRITQNQHDFVVLRWKDIPEVDGYFVERSREGYNEFVPLSSYNAVNIRAQESVITLRDPLPATGAEVTLELENAPYSYTVQSGDSLSTIASELASLIDVDEYIYDVVSVQSSSIYLSAIKPGKEYDEVYTYGFNYNYDITTDPYQGDQIDSGYIVLKNLEPQTSKYLTLIDDDVKDGRDYEFRITPFRFIPYIFSEGTYTTQFALENDVANFSQNVLWGAPAVVVVEVEEN